MRKKEDNIVTLETMNELTANIASILVIPFCLLFFVGFAIFNGGYAAIIEEKANIWTILTMLLTIPGIVCHELLHAFGWILSGKNFSDFKFGLKPFAAYIQFDGKMKTEQFMVGLILPFIATGLIPMIVGLLTHNFYIFIYGFILAPGCGSDILSFIRCFKHLGKQVSDTKGKTGFMVFEY